MRTVMQLRSAARRFCARRTYEGTILSTTANAASAWRRAFTWHAPHQARACPARQRQYDARGQELLLPVGAPTFSPEIEDPDFAAAPALGLQWLVRLYALRPDLQRKRWVSRHSTIPWAHICPSLGPSATDIQPLGRLPPPADVHFPHRIDTLCAHAALPDAPPGHGHNAVHPIALPPIDAAPAQRGDTHGRRENVAAQHAAQRERVRQNADGQQLHSHECVPHNVDAQDTPAEVNVPPITIASRVNFSCPPLFAQPVLSATFHSACAYPGARVADDCHGVERFSRSSAHMTAVADNGTSHLRGGTEPDIAQLFLWTLPPLTFAESRDNVPVPMQPLRHRKSGLKAARHASDSLQFKGLPAGWYGWRRRARRLRTAGKRAASELRADAMAAARQGALGANLWL